MKILVIPHQCCICVRNYIAAFHAVEYCQLLFVKLILSPLLNVFLQQLQGVHNLRKELSCCRKRNLVECPPPGRLLVGFRLQQQAFLHRHSYRHRHRHRYSYRHRHRHSYEHRHRCSYNTGTGTGTGDPTNDQRAFRVEPLTDTLLRYC